MKQFNRFTDRQIQFKTQKKLQQDNKTLNQKIKRPGQRKKTAIKSRQINPEFKSSQKTVKRERNNLDWLGLKDSDLNRSIRWIQRARLNGFQKKIFATVLAALVYLIWHSRNRKIWQGTDCYVDDIINNVKKRSQESSFVYWL